MKTTKPRTGTTLDKAALLNINTNSKTKQDRVKYASTYSQAVRKLPTVRRRHILGAAQSY